jgi:general secretion pathway protein E
MTVSQPTALLTYSFAKTHAVIAEQQHEQLTIYHRTTLSPELLHELQRHLGKSFQLRQLDEIAFNKKMTSHYESSSHSAIEMMAGMEESLDLSELINTLPTPQDLLDSHDDAPIIRLLNALFAEAIKQHASDIHIESYANHVLIRLRIDGVLRQALDVSRLLGPLIISRIKVMAKLDIAEKRLPQDGHIRLTIAGHPVDVRVSTLPANHAERVVLRILDKNVAQLQLQLLGMSKHELSALEHLLKLSHGIILVTGPTGSGKTTSLYAMLTELNDISRNILTVEDPIEYDLPGIGQTQVNSRVDMTFAKGLRAILRQDPDIIMVGEIRDTETASIAVQASLTGHLVLSTLHTNSAIGAITRLHDMGVQPFLLASSLVGVIAQRLLRVLCSACKVPHQATTEELAFLQQENHSPVTLYTASGCSACHLQGYQGRTGIYEVVTINNSIKNLIHDGCRETDLETVVRTQTPSLQQAGINKVLCGDTSLEELLRVIQTE